LFCAAISAIALGYGEEDVNLPALEYLRGPVFGPIDVSNRIKGSSRK